MMVPEACLDILNSHTTQISSTFWTLWINETCMVWTCHKPWQPLQNQPSAVQSTLEGGQCHGQQRKCWINNIKKWTSLPMSEPPMPELPKVASRKKQNKQKKRLNHPSCPSEDPISHETQLNWICLYLFKSRQSATGLQILKPELPKGAAKLMCANDHHTILI